MTLLLYITISSLGLIVGNLLSVIYLKYKKNIYIILYYIFTVYCGSQHYAIIFNENFHESWFFIDLGSMDVSGLVKSIAVMFIIFTIMTIPPSKFSLIKDKLFNR